MIKVFGEGVIVEDPELKMVGKNDENENGIEFVEFAIVTNEYRQLKDGGKSSTPHFFTCNAWSSGAATIAKHAKKGDRIVFMARPRQERWVSKNGGNRSRVVFRIEQFKIVPKDSNRQETEVED